MGKAAGRGCILCGAGRADGCRSSPSAASMMRFHRRRITAGDGGLSRARARAAASSRSGASHRWRMRSAPRAARAAGGRRFRACCRCQPRLAARDGARVRAARCQTQPALVRGAVSLENDRSDMALLRAITGLPIVAGQSEISQRGLPRPDDRWRNRHLQSRRQLGRRPDGLAARCPHGAVFRSSRWGITANRCWDRTSWRRSKMEPTSRRHHPDRDPIFHRMVIGRGVIADGHYSLPDAPGFGVAFDADFIKTYRVN